MSPDDIDDSDPIYSCPLILDLDGDGVETNGVAQFDHGGDGFLELTGWVGADDGILVRDLNGNGSIDNGGELFGDNTKLSSGGLAVDGFAGLSDLDKDGDGDVDASDAGWSSLRVLRWVDSDGDGEKETMELATLSDLGIASLETARVSSDHVDAHGNEHRLIGGYTKSDGTTGKMVDVWFEVNQQTTVYFDADIPEHSEEIGALPDARGSGRVYNLRDAMVLDEAGKLSAPYYGQERTEKLTLQKLVDAFGKEGDATKREKLAEKILLRWSGAEDVSASDYSLGLSSLTFTTAEKFAVVEAFRGYQWRAGESNRNPAASTAEKIEELYRGHYEQLWGSLMLRTHLSGLVSAVVVSEDEKMGKLRSTSAGWLRWEEKMASSISSFFERCRHLVRVSG